MPSNEEKLAALRAQLSEAETAAAQVPEDASPAVRMAAEATKAAAEQALAKAHLRAQAAAEKTVKEVRVTKAAEEAKDEGPVGHPHTLQRMNQSASVQNVRGTDALTPEEHARRRNPKRT